MKSNANGLMGDLESIKALLEEDDDLPSLDIAGDPVKEVTFDTFTAADLAEELDRLIAHVAAARALMSEDAAVGRKLDFLCQEFNREANTLCSKSSDVEMTRIGLDLKALIEQFREQVQNIE